MQESEDKNNKAHDDNFIVKEIKERISINQKSKIFKEAVDFEKEAMIERMEEQHVKRDEQITDEVSRIEMALMSDDQEKIKVALKEFQGVYDKVEK